MSADTSAVGVNEKRAEALRLAANANQPRPSDERQRVSQAIAQLRSARAYLSSNVTLGTSSHVQEVLDAWDAFEKAGHR